MGVGILDWLRSEDGARAMEEAGAHLDDPLAAVTALRRVWSREQSAAAVQQAALRRRAARKFSQADRMFFEAEALEQASGETIAGWRARRFDPFDRIADLCCGIGGDTLALARTGWTVGVDLDAERVALARANAAALGLTDRSAFVRARVPVLAPRVAAAFADPDRRPGGVRTRRLAGMRPSLPELLELNAHIPSMGIKLSPALDDTELAALMGGRGYELELISEEGVCKEAVLWLGDFVMTRRRASVLPPEVTLTDSDAAEISIRAPGAYLFEPDPAVIRAHLVQQAAAVLGTWRLDAHLALLSGDRPTQSPFARCFTVLEIVPPNVKEIGRRLRTRGYGSVVVKRRASAVDPEAVRRQMLPFLTRDSSREAVVLFTRIRERRVAFLCEEVMSDE